MYCIGLGAEGVAPGDEPAAEEGWRQRVLRILSRRLILIELFI